jgi:hypothetical protein
VNPFDLFDRGDLPMVVGALGVCAVVIAVLQLLCGRRRR